MKGFRVTSNKDAGCKGFVTSPDEAHLTWLADIRGGGARWSENILRDCGLSLSLFPEIKNPTEIAGHLCPEVRNWKVPPYCRAGGGSRCFGKVKNVYRKLNSAEY